MEPIAPQRRRPPAALSLLDVLGVGLVAEGILDHLDSTDHKAARLCCKSVKAQVDRHIKEVHLELPDSAKEQKLLAAALHKSTGLHPTTLCLSHSGSRPGSKNAGEFIASPKLLHLLQNVQQLFFTTQPLGKGLATALAKHCRKLTELYIAAGTAQKPGWGVWCTTPLLHLTSVTLSVGQSQRGPWASIWGALRRMPSLAHLSFTGGCSAEAQLIDVNPVSQLTQLRHFSLDDVPHTLDYSCLSNLTSLTQLLLCEPQGSGAGQQQHQQQPESGAQQCERMGKSLSMLPGLVDVRLPCPVAPDALRSLTALTGLTLGVWGKLRGRHGWEQHITGEPIVLPGLKSLACTEACTLGETDEVLCFLAGTHMPSLKKVKALDRAVGPSIRPSNSNPWWKQALVKAAAGNLRKCSTVELNLLDMSGETSEEAAVAFLTNWKVEESLQNQWALVLVFMAPCTSTALSHLPQGLGYLSIWCCLLADDSLLPAAVLQKLRVLEVGDCHGLSLQMLRSVLRAAVQGSSLHVRIRKCGISRRQAQRVYYHMVDESGEENVPRVTASLKVLTGESSDDSEDSDDEGDAP